MKRAWYWIAAGALAGSLVSAQEKPQKKVLHEAQGDTVVVHDGHGAGTVAFSSARMSFNMMNVKGAPYSAETVNESVQVLADGNRIVHKNTGKVYRDSEGRTRFESSFAPLGNWVPEGEPGTVISIADPVAGEHITLNSKTKTASKMKTPAIKMRSAAPAGADGSDRIMIRKDVTASAGTLTPMVWVEGGSHAGAAGMAKMNWVGEGDVKSESLGKQTIEGVVCDGTRETMTIAAGAMGNERPIVVTTERWTSPELGIDVLRKHVDPRTGENTYKVTMIQRGEPAKSLFEVPPDYKLQDSPKIMHFDRKLSPKDDI